MLFLLAVPLLIYIASSFSVPKDTVRTPADFFVAFRRSSTIPFFNSSVAYAFQVATVFPFLTWAVAGTVFVPFLNAVFWGLGILLFSLTLRRLRTFFGTSMSLHSFLGTAYGSKTMQIVTSGLTVLGLLGVALGEITWGSQAVAVVTQRPGATYAVMAVMMLLVFAYIGYGGQVSSFRTDQLQLVFAYIGVLSLLGMMFLRVSSLTARASNLTRWSALVAIAYSVAILVARRGKILARTDRTNSFDTLTTKASNSSVIIAFAGVIVVSAFLLPPQATPLDLVRLDTFGGLGVASMILLPLGWQFVDMTNWQRLLALQGDSTEEIKAARFGLRLYALESPFTWIVFLMLGAAAVDVFPTLQSSGNILSDLPRTLIAEGIGLGYWCAILFLISILAIMLSTIDSVLIAAMFTFMRDMLPLFRVESADWFADNRDTRTILWQGRVFGVVLLMTGVGAYIFMDASGHAGERFIGALFALYTAQLSMLPPVLGALFLRTPPPGRFVLPGLLAGACVGIGLGLYATFARPDLQWWPVPACLIVSFGLYGIGLLLHRLHQG